MEKIFNQKNFINFVWSPLGSRGVCSLILFPLFATGVYDTGGKFTAGVLDSGGNLPPMANLPPVSMTPVVPLAKLADGAVDIGGKFSTGVVDTPSQFAAGVVDTDGAP